MKSLVRALMRIALAVLVVSSMLSAELYAQDACPAFSNRPIESDSVRPLFPNFSDAELDLLDLLETRVTVDFHRVPLKEAVAELSKKYGFPTAVGESDGEVSSEYDKPVTLSRKKEKLRVVLSSLLGQFELDWRLADSRVLIMYPGLGSDRKPQAIYPVGDLVSDPEDLQTLSEIIEDGTNAMWEKLDGDGGRIQVIRSAKSLMIIQTMTVHYEIMHLLDCLRAAKRISGEMSHRNTDQ